MKSFSLPTFLLNLVIGSILTFGLLAITGNKYAEPLLPMLGIFSCFMVTGMITGALSKDITIIEPGVASMIVSILIFILNPVFNYRAFELVTDADWFIILLNSVILTFIGAWVGEKLQNGVVGDVNAEKNTSSIDWSWVLAGTVIGIIASLIIVNFFGLVPVSNPFIFFIPFAVILLVTGVIVGWMSPGITIREAGLAGFLTITIDLDIVRVSLIELGFTEILIALVIGFIVTYLGGYLGEKMQEVEN